MRGLAFVTGALVIVSCSSPAPSARSPETGGGEPAPSIASDDTLSVPLGSTAATRDNSLRITFVQLVNESRCPANVVCVWEGDAAVKLRVQAGRSVADTTIHTRLEPRILEVGGFRLSLLEVQPYPGTTDTPRSPAIVVRAVR